jgi:hypothetical protein
MQYIKTQGLLVDTVKNEFNVLNDAISLSADTKQFSLFSGEGISLSADTKQFSLFSGEGISLSGNTKQFNVFGTEGIILDVNNKNISFLNGVISFNSDTNVNNFKAVDNGNVGKSCVGIVNNGNTTLDASVSITTTNSTVSSNSLSVNSKNSISKHDSISLLGDSNTLANSSINILGKNNILNTNSVLFNSNNSTVSSGSVQINGNDNFVDNNSLSILGSSNFVTNSSTNIASNNNKIYNNSLNIDGFNNLVSSNSVALNSYDSNLRDTSLAINTFNSGLSTNSILINSLNTTSELSSINLLGNNNTLNDRSVLLNGSNNTIATNSLAFNTDNSSVTGNSVVLGGNSNIVNDFSFVVASSASKAYQESSVIGGKGNTASLSAVAIGSVNTQIIGQNSQSIGGSNNDFNSSNSVFLGGQNNASANVPNGISNGNNSFIIGGNNNKTGNNGIIIGGKDNSVQNNSIVIGGSGNNTGNFSNVVIINRNNVAVDRDDVVYLPEIRAQGNLTITGNITAGGNITSINTVTGNVSAFNINNFLYDIIPLTVDQNKTPSVGTLDSARFNYFGQPRLNVNNIGVSINTNSSVANQALTVSGNVSASGNLKVDNTLLIGSDTNLYRSATNTLKTDDTFIVGNVTVPTSLTTGTTNTVITHSSNSLEQRTINSRVWDTAATFLSGSGTTNQILKLTGPNTIGNSSIADNGSTVSVTGNLNVDSNTLYVDSTNNRIGVLTTTPNETLTVSGSISAKDLLKLTGGTTSSNGILFGSDTNLYRSTTNTLKTDDTFVVGGITIPTSLATGTTNTVVTHDSNTLAQRAIDSRVWGTTLVDGGGTTNYISKWTDSNTVSSSQVFDNGTNVGIGTTTPNARLTVSGGISATGDVSVNTGSRLNLATGSTGMSIFRDAAANGMAFTNNNLTRMFISDDGNVGIGTSNPNEKLTVSGGISATGNVYVENFSKAGMLLVQNKRNAYFGRVGLTENKFHLNESNIGTVWTTRQSIRDWVDIAMSSDGRYQTAPLGQSNVAGNIYVSTDFGVNWSSKALAKVWTSVAMSSDGRYQTAVAWGDSVYVSSDFGSTWTSKAVVEYWSSVAMSSDGRYQYAITSNLSYISRDFGSTWTSGNALGFDIAMSSDGRIVAICDGLQSIAISYDFGSTFSIKYTSTNGYPFKITMSSDGRYITASSYSATNGYVYTSTNFGSTFSAKTLITGSGIDGYGVAMSSDGRIQTSCWVGNTIRQSTDWGETWVSKGGTGSWWGIAMSSDGGRQTVVDAGGYIYTSNCDIVNYENLSVVGSVSANGTVIGSGTIQIGTQANKATLTYTTNTARTYTIPDAGANADFVMDEGNQTIAGTKTFSSNIAGSITGNAATATTLQTARTIWGQSFNGSSNITGNITASNVVMGTQTNKATLTYTTNTARTYTIPDAGANADFVMDEGNQTIAGTKTFSGNTTFPNGAAATPSINFTGSTNTGFYFATNQVSTSIAGTEKFRVTNNFVYTPKLLVNTISTSTEVFKVEGDSRLKDTYINSNGQEFLISNNYGVGSIGRNIYIGNGGQFTAGTSSSFGSYNTSLGGDALSAITTGRFNTAVGYISQQKSNTGQYNTSVGYSSLLSVTDGQQNTAVGYEALKLNLSDFNTAIGSNAMDASNSPFAQNNTAVGCNAFERTPYGYENTAIGANSMREGTSNTGTVYGNTAVGYNSLLKCAGYDNTGIGTGAGGLITTGFGNSLLGAGSGPNITIGSANVCLGNYSGYNITTGSYNVSVGANMNGTTTGNNNIAIGDSCLNGGANISNCVAVGVQALLNNRASSNVAVGYQAGASSGSDPAVNPTGLTYIGYLAGTTNTIGTNNTAVGDRASYLNTAGASNTAIGRYAHYNNDSGSSCVAIGYNALYEALGSTNIGIGANAGRLTGSGGAALTTGTGNIMIGSYSRPSAATGINQIVIGNSLAGVNDNTFTLGTGTTYIHTTFTGGNGTPTWTRVSDISLKKNINKNNLGLNFIKKINPVTYNWIENNKLDKSNPHYREENEKDSTSLVLGLIAQNVKQAMDEEGADYFSGWSKESSGLQGISLEPFILPLINAVKELTERLEKLESKIK